MWELTPFQTIGPFFHHALTLPGGETLPGEKTAGQRVLITGTVRDGARAVVPDALLEIWQADAAGRYHHPEDVQEGALDPAFDGFGRAPTDDAGRFSFVTVKPGPVPGPDDRQQAPHVLVGILARGILARLVTRIYFEDEPSNARDPILQLVPVERRQTLVARAEDPGRDGLVRYRFDIVLQGENETVFFDV